MGQNYLHILCPPHNLNSYIWNPTIWEAQDIGAKRWLPPRAKRYRSRKVWPYAQTCGSNLSHEMSIPVPYNSHRSGASVPIHAL
eukprot:2576442-Karenia_brevis.AAC.1